MASSNPVIGIVMGSDSDWPVMEAAREVCRSFELVSEVRVLSAHRTPEAAAEYAGQASSRGLRVLIAGAGAAAHLPGVLAAYTHLPVIGVPIASSPLSGFDSLLAIVQMPRGIPVATVGVGRADNGALLAVHILAVADEDLARRLAKYRRDMRERVEQADRKLQERL